MNKVTHCLAEHVRDGIELSLGKRAEQLINEGDIESADVVLENKEKISEIDICE